VFQAFLTKFLIDSGYKIPIRNMDELFASGTKLAYPEEYSSIVENGDETEKFKIEKNRVNCPKSGCLHWAKHHKNI